MQGRLKYYLVTFLYVFIISSFITPQGASSQVIPDNKVKAGYIFNFLKYVTWQNENQFDEFIIGIYGDDVDFIKEITEIEKLLVHEKPIKIIRFFSLDEIQPTQILVLSNDKKYFIKEVLDKIKSNNTLLISDRCEYQHYVMLNFIYSDNSKISFEINSKNIEEAGLKTSSKLVLLGGSEIDVRKLYRETEKSLISEKEKSENYERELVKKKNELEKAANEINKKQKEIGSLQKNINNQKVELDNLKKQTDTQKEALFLKNKELNNQQLLLEKRNKELAVKILQVNGKQKEIEKYSKVLAQQNSEITKRQSIIDSQGKVVINQLSRIKTQQTFLYLLVSLFLTALALVFMIFRSYRLNKKRKIQLEEINVELEKLSIVASRTDNAIAIMDANGRFEWVNDGFHRLYGFSLSELIKVKGETIQSSSNYDDIITILARINLEKKSATYETSTLSNEGHKIWIHSTLTPILDEQKNIKKLIVIDADITQLKEAELAILDKNEEIQRQSEELYEQAESLMALNHELEDKNNKLEDTLAKLKNTQSQLVESEKMVVLGQLTAGIAHEINNPINYINSGIEGLGMAFENLLKLINKYENIAPENFDIAIQDIEHFKKDIEYIELLKDIEILTRDIKNGVNRTIEIVRGLRTFSRVDESDAKSIDIHSSIDSTLVILRNKYLNRIEIVKQYGIIPDIECYPGKINQVLLNILVNAIQAIEGDGTITIKTALHTGKGNEFVSIEIKDTGNGMSGATQRKIFEPFFTTKDVGEGTGLGLSISKSIIDGHNGTIEVESELGKGAKFLITLPVTLQKHTKPTPIFEK